MIKLLGILDIATAILFWMFIVFNASSLSGIILLLGLFLLVKGIAFSANLDITSIFDIASAVIILIASSREIHIIFVIAVCLFLFQKGIFSLFK